MTAGSTATRERTANLARLRGFVTSLAELLASTRDEAEVLHAAQRGATPLYIEGTGHTFGAVHPWAGTTPALDQVMEATIRWLGRHLA